MTKDTGTMYMEFEDSCYYDEMKDILCFGNPYLQGETVEFASNTYAVICKGRLIAVFMKIPFLKEKIVIRDGRFHGKMWENTTGNSVISMVTDSFKKIRGKFISKFEK